MQAKQKAALKAKKKKWCRIIARKPFGEFAIGEIPVTEPADAVGRILSVNMMAITNDPKKQGINIRFIVDSANKDNVSASVIGYSMIGSSIRRLIRKGTERIDESYVLTTADNKKIILKTFLLTKQKTKNSVLATSRKTMKAYLVENIKKMNYEDIVSSLLAHRFQNELKSVLNKVYPLRICEIRHLELVMDKTKKAQQNEAPAEKTEEKAPEIVKEEYANVKAQD